MTNPILAKVAEIERKIRELERQSAESDSVKFREKIKSQTFDLQIAIRAIRRECKHPNGRKLGYSFTCPDCGYSADDEPYCHAHTD